MEAFTVQCTTCQSKLRVRDPNLIHQIVSCPKCNSMIQVEPPGQISVQPPGQYNVDSTAVTREVHYPPGKNASSVDQHAGEAGRVVDAGAVDDQPTLENVDWSEDEFRLAPLDDDQSGAAAEAVPNWQPTEAPPPPLTPSDEWTSPRAAQSKQYLMIGFVGVGGILAAGLMFFFFMRWINGRPASELAVTNPPPVAAVGDNEATSDKSDPEASGDAPTGSTIDAAVDGANDDLMPKQAAGESEGDVAGDLVGPGDSEATETGRELPATVPDSNMTDLAATASDNNEVDPSGAGDSDTAAADGPAADGSEGSGLTLPKQLQDFQQLFGYQIVPSLPDTQVLPTEAPLTAEELGFDVSATSAAAPTLNIAELSKVEMPAMVFRGRSLSSVVNLWTHLSGIPTVVDLQAMAAAGLDPGKPVDLKLTAQAALPLGRSIASAVGCNLVEQDTSHLLITPPTSKLQEHLPDALKLDALIADETARQWLDQAIVELLPELTGLTQWQGSELQFAANEQTAQSGWIAWFRLVQLLDNWHQAAMGSGLAELKSAMAKQPLLDPFNLAALDKKMDFVVAESLPSGQLLTRCADQAGMQCWIDWASVAEGGLHPGARFASVTYHREFRRILADYAAEYSLVVAVLDEGSLWLASAPRYRAETRLYVIPSDGRTVEQWQQQLRPLTPIAADGSSLLRIIATPDEQWVLVRCCPPALR